MKKESVSSLKKKPKTVSQLKKEADKYWSIATRYRFANDDGTAECVTCQVRKPIKELQCGHFMSRRFNYTRFSEFNTAPHCSGCNIFKSGEQYKYSQFIEDFYGVGTAKQIQKESQEYHKFTTQELEEIIKDAKEQIKFYEADKLIP